MSSVKSPEKAIPILPAKREGTKFVAELPKDAKVAIIPGVGIVAASPDHPPTLNGEIIKPDPPKELTPAELDRRLKNKAYLREHGVQLAGDDKPIANVVDAAVMSTANPYLSLFREYRSGLITLDQMIESIDMSICSDVTVLNGFEFKPLPTKPANLVEAEGKVREKSLPDEWHSKITDLHRKLAAVNDKIAEYLKSVERIKAENLSNLWYLREMLKRQTDKNPVYAGRLRSAVYTHNEAA